MSDSGQPGIGGQDGRGRYPAPQWPYPELPDDVAIAGRKEGKRYLHRPGELVARRQDLERNSNGMLRQLQDDFGAVILDEPPSRMSCRDHPLLTLDREPDGVAVTQACEQLRASAGVDGDPLSILRDRLERRHERLRHRDKRRKTDARLLFERQNIVMLKLPEVGPNVAKVLKVVRSTRTGGAGIWANQVFAAQQDWGWVNTVPVGRLGEGEELPPLPDGYAGRGVRVAVVDTGLRTKHEWLEPFDSDLDDLDYEELDEDGDFELDPEAGHGTFVAGIVLQHAPGATIVGRSLVDTRGHTDDVALASTLLSLEDECIDIVNMSVGGLADRLSPAPSTRRAMDALRTRNPRTVFVAAAGNRNRSDPFYPAAFDQVVAVGALDRDLRRAPFSNYGPWVDAWAQGIDIRSSYVGTDVTATKDTDIEGSDGAVWSGTSFAAPRVAGGIAAAMSPGR